MELALRRKWTLKAHGHQQVFLKRAHESTEHVLMKAGLWALHVAEYPQLHVERGIGDRYTPDVVALGPDGTPAFWGEAGKVTPAKVASLTRRYPNTKLVLAKWAMRLQPVAAVYQRARDARHTAPLCLLGFPRDTAAHIDADGTFTLPRDAVEQLVL